VKRTSIFVCLVVLCNVALFAQTADSFRIVHLKKKPTVHVPPQEAPEGLKKIYSNLGTSTELYNSDIFLPLYGPYSTYGQSLFWALPFTPKSNSHVSEVRVAIQYLGSGANQVNLSIYGGSGGAPGTPLAGPVTVTDLPDSPTCCILTVADFPPIAVTEGTQYWVVADTPLTGTGSDFSGAWYTVVKPLIPQALNLGGVGWSTFNADGLQAGEVLGTIP
jgi:hypothetical protein